MANQNIMSFGEWELSFPASSSTIGTPPPFVDIPCVPPISRGLTPPPTAELTNGIRMMNLSEHRGAGAGSASFTPIYQPLPVPTAAQVDRFGAPHKSRLSYMRTPSSEKARQKKKRKAGRLQDPKGVIDCRVPPSLRPVRPKYQRHHPRTPSAPKASKKKTRSPPMWPQLDDLDRPRPRKKMRTMMLTPTRSVSSSDYDIIALGPLCYTCTRALSRGCGYAPMYKATCGCNT